MKYTYIYFWTYKKLKNIFIGEVNKLDDEIILNFGPRKGERNSFNSKGMK